DPLVARDLIKRHNPDVLTLDVEMPRMDGLDFLEKLMRLRPMPVVMVSSLTQRGSEITLRALELGAVDFVAKPAVGLRPGLREDAEPIAVPISGAARARPRPRAVAGHVSVVALSRPLGSAAELILVVASTGGTLGIREFLEAMPTDCPGTLITQHVPVVFTQS